MCSLSEGEALSGYYDDQAKVLLNHCQTCDSVMKYIVISLLL